MRRVLAVFVAASLALVLGACNAITPYAAKVNDGTVSQRALESELEAILENQTYLDSLQQSQIRVQGSAQNAFDSTFVARILTRQIFLELVHQEIERRKIELSRADLDQAEADVAATFEDPKVLSSFPKSYRELLFRRTAEVTALQADLAKVDLTDETIREYYAENEAQFRETCVEHILYEDKLAADAARARINAGQDCATVARAEAKDPGSGADGGKLGCVGPGNFVPEFEQAMDRLQPDQISEPVQSQFGFHLIRVTSRRTKPLAEATDEIRQRLLSGAQGAFNEFLQTTLEKARIEVNPRYGRFEKSGQQPGVVPPDAPQPAPRGTTPEPPGGAVGVGGAGEDSPAPPGASDRR